MAVMQIRNFVIPIGSNSNGSTNQQLNVVTSQPFNFMTDPTGTWNARMEVRDSDGNLITRYHSDTAKNWPGRIVLTPSGYIRWYLPAAATTDLAYTASYGPTGSRAPAVAALEVIDPDGEPHLIAQGPVVITQEVTTSA